MNSDEIEAEINELLDAGRHYELGARLPILLKQFEHAVTEDLIERIEQNSAGTREVIPEDGEKLKLLMYDKRVDSDVFEMPYPDDIELANGDTLEERIEKIDLNDENTYSIEETRERLGLDRGDSDE